MPSLNSLKIGTKLVLLTIATVAVGASVSIHEATKLRAIDNTYSAVRDVGANGTVKLAEVTGNSDSIGRVLYRMIAEMDEASIRKSSQELNDVFIETEGFGEQAAFYYPERKVDFDTLRTDLHDLRTTTPAIEAAAATEQSTGLNEVGIAVNHMNQVTPQNAAMVEESNAATNRLADEASNLARLITRFKLDNNVSGPRIAKPGRKLALSQPRALGRKLASAFGSNIAMAAMDSDWEEF